MDNHYKPSSIRWTHEQIKWILRWSEIIQSGRWPSDYKESGYVGGNKSHNQRAPYETPIQIWAELTKRIERTNQDGYFLQAVYSNDNRIAEMERIAKAFHMDINEVSDRVERALRYCTGWCRRWMKCSSCRVKDCPSRGKKKAYEYNSWRY